MKKFVLAYNPVSGGGEFKKKLDKIVHLFQLHGCLIVPYRTTPADEGFIDCLKAVRPRGIIVAGGDGTLNRIVNLQLKAGFELPLAIFPSGTSNDFATCLGVGAEKLSHYVERIASDKRRLIDIGKVNDRYFVNVVSAGRLTSVAHGVDRRLKNTFGKLAYYMRGLGELPKFRPLQLNVNADGQVRSCAAFFVLIVNSRVVAGLKNVSVEAQFDDGKLDLIMLEQCGIPDLVGFTAELVARKPVTANAHITYLQAEKFFIDCAEKLESDIDGESGPCLPLHVETIKKGLEIYF